MYLLLAFVPSEPMDTRVMLGRLLQSLEKAHNAQGDALDTLRAIIAQTDASGQVKIPPVREMIRDVLLDNYAFGMNRSEIINQIRRDYGVDMSPNTVTGTLARMQREKIVLRRGQIWFPSKK
jgi:hypothetical protein